jgi:hypothetical protein
VGEKLINQWIMWVLVRIMTNSWRKIIVPTEVRQTALYTATWPPEVKAIARQLTQAGAGGSYPPKPRNCRCLMIFDEFRLP